MGDPYDPSQDDGGDFETAMAKQRLRQELGITNARPRNIGSSTLARLDHNLGNVLARSGMRQRLQEADREEIEAARARADPEGLLTDADVVDVLERAGVSPP